MPPLSTVNGYLERLANNPDAYTPTVKVKIEWRIGITGKSLLLSHARGVKIAFGTDTGFSRHGHNVDEFELMLKLGMTPTEAIKSATVKRQTCWGAIAGSL